MAISKELKFVTLNDLYLDPTNPRLGRNNTGREVEQSSVLDHMKDWTLEELAVSFLEAGAFWTHEAFACCEGKMYTENCV